MKNGLVAGCVLALCILPSAFAADGAKKAKGVQFETTTYGNLLDIFRPSCGFVLGDTA